MSSQSSGEQTRVEPGPPIRGLFFDLGGTLFSYTGRLGGGGIVYLLKTFGIEAQPAEIGERWGEAASQVGEHFGAKDYFLHKDLFRESAIRFLAQYDKQANAEQLDAFHAAQLASMLKHLPLREDCKEALATLKRRGLYLSIVSNIDDDYLDPLVAQHGLDEWLDHWTSSEEARSCKPDARIFHHALDKAGLNLDEVLFVGDSLHHDVAGAAAIGMRSVRIIEPGIKTPLTHGLEVTADPDFEIDALTELSDIVAQLNVEE